MSEDAPPIIPQDESPDVELYAELSREELKDWELRQLPDKYYNMTYRGRYAAQDKEMLSLIWPEGLPEGTVIRVLDFAGGVLPFGSPTAHDLADAISVTGQEPEITVVDKNIPGDLKPNNDQIEYRGSLDPGKDTDFDIVRVMRLIEHIPDEEYQTIRNDITSRLREGGLFISTQILNRYNYGGSPGKGPRALTPIIKVMQKRESKLVPVAILPDSNVPWSNAGWFVDMSKTQEEYDAEYQVFRESIASGSETLSPELNQDSFDNVIKGLNLDTEDSIKSLMTERSILQPYIDQNRETFKVTYPKRGDITEVLKSNAIEAPRLFAAGILRQPTQL